MYYTEYYHTFSIKQWTWMKRVYLFLLFNDAISAIDYEALNEMGKLMIMNDE
jgi:hypothetical protein